MLTRLPVPVVILLAILLIGSAVYSDPSLPNGCAPSLGPRSASYDITYIYDELGRLIAVVDPAGDTVVYNYDAVGNLLSISRYSSATVSIIRFTPNSGAVGASVTIYGTGFDTTPSQNTVTFNDVMVTVTSATPTQIITSVPAGATTGTITVTSPAGSATSSAPFTVTSGASGAPTITGFTPTVGTPGTAVTITGANFETAPTNNITKFNITPAAVSSATASSIAVNVPTATSGRISVATPAGSAVSSGDFFVPPPPYTTADVVLTGRIAFGETKPVAINTGNKIGLYLFDGIAGRRVSLNVSGRTISHSQVTIYSPDRAVLTTNSFYSWQGDIFYEPKTLPLSGTYTILAASLDNTTGSMSLTPYDVPADIAGSIVIAGSPVTVTLTTGQNGSLTFSGTAGQKMSMATSNSTISACDVLIKKPDGSQVGQGLFPAGTGAGFMDSVILPVTGQYSISVDPRAAYSGSITLTLYDATDVTGTITVGGSPVTVTTTIPGQNDILSFVGTAGRRVSLNITGKTITECAVYVKKPDGSSLYSQYMPPWWSSAFMDSTTLPVSGTYTILVDPYYQYSGSITMTLYDTTADVTGTITIGGTSVTMSIPTPGQNGLLTFSGTAGQRVGLNMSSVTIASSTVTIKKPDGTSVASTSVGVGGAFLETNALPITGNYTILIDPYGAYTGNITLTLTDISDVTATVTPGGAPVTITTTTAGQNIRASCSGAAGQRISLKVSIAQNCYVTIYKPDGSALTSQLTILGGNGVGFVDVTVLPVAGTYAILVDMWATASGSATLTLYDVPVDVTGTISIGGQSQAVTITTPGQNASLTFSGTTGRKVSLRMTGVTITSCIVYIKKPDGSVLGQIGMGTGGAFIDTVTLPVTGTYTILIDPTTFYVGNTTQTLYDASDFTGAVTIGGPAVTVAISNPGQNGQLTFSGTSGQQITVRVTSNTASYVTVKLLKPDGSQLTSTFSGSSSFNLATQTLPVTGTYTIVIDPSGTNTGSLNISVTSP